MDFKLLNPIFAAFCAVDTRPFMSLVISGKTANALLDSGSTHSYVGSNFSQLFGKFDSAHTRTTVANQDVITVVGEKLVFVQFEGLKRPVTLRHTPPLAYPLLMGIDFLQSFGFILNFVRKTLRLPGGERVRFLAA